MEKNDEAWERVEKWWRQLEASASDYPVQESLCEKYREIEQLQPQIERGAMLSRSSAGSPLAALFSLVDFGMYPPPELLLALCDDFSRYERAQGKMSLEDVFFGAPKPRVGNFASREAMKLRRQWIAFQLYEKLRNGLTLTAAAAQVATELGDGTDADAILRANRGLKRFRAKHAASGDNPAD